MPEAEVDSTSGSEGPVAQDAVLAVAAVEAAEAAPVEVEQARTKRLGVFGWFAIVWLVVVAAMAVAPGLFPVADVDHRFREPIVEDKFGPRTGHWLGFDDSGFDMMSKVIYGTRASMIVSVGAIAIGLVAGGFLGLVAGYFRGWIDT